MANSEKWIFWGGFGIMTIGFGLWLGWKTAAIIFFIIAGAIHVIGGLGKAYESSKGENNGKQED